MAKAIRIYETGRPEVMRFEEVAVDAPSSGEVVVRHTAIGLNYIDTYHRSGLYPVTALPCGLGMEAAGIVERVGPDVTEVRAGDRVAYASGPPGAYAQVRLIRADRLVPLPQDIGDELAAAMMLKGMTAEYLIRRTFPVQRGQTVLVHAAAGGVGLLACQWLEHLGAQVIGTVGTQEKAALASANGCHHPIVYTTTDFVKRVREITNGAGVPVVYDSVGRATFAGSLDCLSPRGMLVSFGNASGKPEPFDTSLLAQKGSLYLTRPALFAYTSSREDLLASAQALFDVVRRGVVKVDIRQRWPLAETLEAHRRLEARMTTGSSILLP